MARASVVPGASCNLAVDAENHEVIAAELTAAFVGGAPVWPD